MNEISMPATEPTVSPPDGMMQNRYGGFTPVDKIKEHTLLEDQLVTTLLRRAQGLSRELSSLREDAFDDVDQFLGLLAEKYDAPRGGMKGNVTFESFDGLRRVQIAIGDFLSFGPELQTAKSLVDACLSRWTDGANGNLKAIVDDAFDVGKEGKLRVDRILALRSLKITEPEWLRAMEAISDAVRVTRSKRYVRFYERRDQESLFVQVPLDLSRAP